MVKRVIRHVCPEQDRFEHAFGVSGTGLRSLILDHLQSWEGQGFALPTQPIIINFFSPSPNSINSFVIR